MRKEVNLSPKNLAWVLDVPAYLFADLVSIKGEMLEDRSVVVTDSETPALIGLILTPEMSDWIGDSRLFSQGKIKI